MNTNKILMKATLVACGILNWHRNERIYDRYGSIHLHMGLIRFNGEPVASDYIIFPSGLDGLRGKLIAKVLESRQTSHCGDIARGIIPSRPERGETIELGEGTVFINSCSDKRFPKAEQCAISTIGIIPDDGRETDWLNPEALYRLHEQTVALFFAPYPGQGDLTVTTETAGEAQ